MKNYLGFKSYQYLTDKRNIPIENITKASTAWILEFFPDYLEMKMKDLDGNIIGSQIRYIDENKNPKSMVRKWSKVGYFYLQNINYQQDIVITEWEIDYLSICHIANVVWLQWVNMLRKLILALQEKWAHRIILLIDNDDPADKAIEKTINDNAINLEILYDARKYLWKQKDINDVLKLWWKLTLNDLIKVMKPISEGMRVSNDGFNKENYFLKTARWHQLDHNNFAKHIVKNHNINASDQACFQYFAEEWIRKKLWKQDVYKLIIQLMEEELKMEYISINNKNKIYDFLLTHAENDQLKKSLETKREKIYEIYLADGIYDIQKDQLRHYTKDDFAFSKLQYLSSDLLQDPPNKRLIFLDQIFEGWNHKEKIKEFLQEFVWYLFVPCVKFEKALLLYWSGCNGKWVLLSVIEHILWSSNASYIWLHEISKEQNIYLLVWKLANIDSDMQHGVQIDSGIIKKLISWEQVTWKVVFEKPINFSSYARIVVATNSLPYIKNIDNAIRRRFIFLNLKQNFMGKQDHDLKEKLYTEDKNIFSRAMVWLKRLIERWRFLIPSELEEDLQEYIKESDSVALFLESGRTEEWEWRFILYRDLYRLYGDFCKAEGFTPLWSRRLNASMSDKWFIKRKKFNWRWFEWIWWAKQL